MRAGAGRGRAGRAAGLALAAGLSAAPLPAAAGPVEAARSFVFAGQRPLLGWSEEGENTNGWRAVAVYEVSRASASGFVARRTNGAGARTFVTAWADSRTCPALAARLTALAGLSARFLAPGRLERWPSAPVAVDGTDYTIWGHGFTAAPASYAQLEMTENLGPVADWAGATDTALEPCWSPAAPDPAR